VSYVSVARRSALRVPGVCCNSWQVTATTASVLPIIRKGSPTSQLLGAKWTQCDHVSM